MKEIIDRLQENRQIEVAKSILESHGYTVSKESRRLKESDYYWTGEEYFGKSFKEVGSIISKHVDLEKGIEFSPYGNSSLNYIINTSIDDVAQDLESAGYTNEGDPKDPYAPYKYKIGRFKIIMTLRHPIDKLKGKPVLKVYR